MNYNETIKLLQEDFLKYHEELKSNSEYTAKKEIQQENRLLRSELNKLCMNKNLIPYIDGNKISLLENSKKIMWQDLKAYLNFGDKFKEVFTATVKAKNGTMLLNIQLKSTLEYFKISESDSIELNELFNF